MNSDKTANNLKVWVCQAAITSFASVKTKTIIRWLRSLYMIQKRITRI